MPLPQEGFKPCRHLVRLKQLVINHPGEKKNLFFLYFVPRYYILPADTSLKVEVQH